MRRLNITCTHDQFGSSLCPRLRLIARPRLTGHRPNDETHSSTKGQPCETILHGSRQSRISKAINRAHACAVRESSGSRDTFRVIAVSLGAARASAHRAKVTPRYFPPGLRSSGLDVGLPRPSQFSEWRKSGSSKHRKRTNARSVGRQASPIRFFACCETFAYRPASGALNRR